VDEASLRTLNKEKKVGDSLENHRPLFLSRYTQYTQ